MRFKVITILAVLATLALAACGGGGREPTSEEGAASGGESGAESVTFDIVMNDIYYGDSPTNAEDPPVWTAPAGAEITLNLQNNGALEHNWALVEPGEEVPVPFVEEEHGDIILEATGLNSAGETTTTTISAPPPGEYQVICTVAGHYPGMQGRLVVEE